MTSNLHGLTHFSASQCSLFEASPASYVLQYLLKKPSRVGAAAYRGSAVEAGTVFGLSNPEAAHAACVDVAMAKFDELAALSGDHRKEKERDAIPGMIGMALTELRPYGVPSHLQRRIEHVVPGLSLPFVGFSDIEWDAHGLIVDLKTLHALPLKIRASHARQVSLYCAASGNKGGRVTYTTSKKIATYGVENGTEHMAALVKIAATIERFLALSPDPMVLASYIAPDFDSFYWSDQETRQAGFEVWGY